MKRIFVFALIIALLTSFSISVNAAEEKDLVDLDDDIDLYSNNEIQVNQTYLDNFAVHYFYKLNSNMATNQVGSCSFVAASMLLSYYDTYWNENIIDEKYESDMAINITTLDLISNSPGIKSERRRIHSDNSSVKSEITESEYWDWGESEKDVYFHFYLLQLAQNQNISSDSSPNVLFPSGIKKLLEYYLYEDRGLSNYNIECEHITGFSDVRSYAIEKVKKGIPVIVTAASLKSAHSFIIYDYDEESGELFCHMGWKDDKTHVAFSTVPYQYFYGAVAITSVGLHVHSNNYIDQTTGNSYCSCYFPCHPEHKCTYTYDDDSHTYSCGCKYEKNIISSEHEYEYKTTGDKCHILTCTTCGKTSGAESGHILKASTSTDKYAMCSVCGAWVYKGGNTIFPTQPYKKEWELEMVESHQKY